MLEQSNLAALEPTDPLEHEVELQALDSMFQPLAAPAPDSHKGFELPRSIWGIMLSCYAVFFATISLATGGSGRARFAIVVSIIYAAIYFGVARIGARQAGPEAPSPLDRGKPLETWTGLMDGKAVYGQILIVPGTIALFGIAIAIVAAFVRIGG